MPSNWNAHGREKGAAMSQHFELVRIAEEESRDQWLAAVAAAQIAEEGHAGNVPDEPLEALSDLIRAELLDRDIATKRFNVPENPF